MTLQTRLDELAEALGADHKIVRGLIGELSNLATDNQTSIVAAINEVNTKALAGGGGSGDGVQIDNDNPAGTTTTYSASKIVSEINAAKTAIIGGASGAYDTLLEIQNALQTDDTDISGLLTAVANRVRYDAAQSLTSPQQAQARANIGALSTVETGNVDVDLVAIYNAAKA